MEEDGPADINTDAERRDETLAVAAAVDAVDESGNVNGDKMEEDGPAVVVALAACSSSAVSAVTAASNDAVIFEEIVLKAIQSLTFTAVGTQKQEQRFQACAMTVYLQAIRTHFMSRPFFRNKRSYASLNEQEYQRQRDILLHFWTANKSNSKNHVDINGFLDAKGFSVYDGDRCLTKVIESMFFKDLGHSQNLIRQLVLPNTANMEELLETDPYVELAKTISSALFPATTTMSSLAAGSSTDLSVVFIDIARFDIVRCKAAVIDFPNRMVVTDAKEGCAPVNYVYQTVGGIYKYTHPDHGDSYICRSFSRERFSGDFFLNDFCMDSLEIKQSKSTPEHLSYIEDFDFDWTSNTPLKLSDPKSKALSMFPCVMNGVDRLTKTKLGMVKKKFDYVLDGIVMCLNDGQREGLVGKNDQLYRMSAATGASLRPSYWLKIQNSMSRLDPIFDCCGQKFYSREMNILEHHKYLSDEIINASMTQFLRVGQALDFFRRDCVVILPAFAFQGILDTLKPNDDQTGPTRSQKPPEVVDLSLFSSAYEQSRELWAYENIFSHPDRWYLTILNYPDRTHWMFLVMNSGEKFFFLYDPLYRQSYSKAVLSVVEIYINAEATAFASSTEGVNYESLKYEAWQKHETTRMSSQKQPDNYSCGVLALIAFFRATVVISEGNVKSSATITTEIVKPWKCPIIPTAMIQYRKKIKQLLIEEEHDPSGFVYFAEVLVGYIKNGGAVF